MRTPGLRVLVGAPTSPYGDTVDTLVSTLTAEGHMVSVAAADSLVATSKIPARCLPGPRGPRPDLLVLPRPGAATTAFARLVRIPLIPLPPTPSAAALAGEVVRGTAGLAERRPLTDSRPLVVAVPTYRRNDQLDTLLTILELRLNEAADLITDRRILVADNDPAAGAAPIVEVHRTRSFGPVDHLHVDVPGVAAARNACLAAARDGELLAFIDDDQIPRPGWLRSLLLARQRTSADAVAGPTRPVYPAGTPAWIEAGPFHDASHLPRDRRMTLSAVTNFLVDIDAVRRMGLSFPSIGTRGGEDSWFTTTLAHRGGLITWEPEAIVDEAVPPSRTEPRWVLTRSLGNGVIAGRLGVRSAASRPHLLGRLRQMTGGAVRIGAGTVRAAYGLGRRDPAAAGGGLHTAFRGLGMALGAWDLVFDEYARAGYSRWKLDHDPEM